MKQVKLFLTIVALICVNTNSWSQTKVKIGDLYYLLSGTTASVTRGDKLDSEYNNSTYIIPETVEYEGLSYTVTSIDNHAFSSYNGNGSSESGSKVSKIIIPNTVTSIGWEVFYLCHNLKSITFPKSLQYFGGPIFDNSI